MTDATEKPPRPDSLEFRPDPIPDELTERDLWLVWRYEWVDDRDGWSKVPNDGAGGGYRIDATDTENGVAFDTALETHQADDYDGLGIITDPDDLLVGFDVDDCRDPEHPHGSVPDVVTELIDTLDSYVEVSPSGEGYRGFALGTKPDGPNQADLPYDPILEDTPHLEVYDGTGGRYLTVTGHHLSGTPETIETRPQEIKDVYERFIATDEPDTEAPKAAGDGGVQLDSSGVDSRVDAGKPGSTGGGNDLTDDELLDRAKNAENGDYFDDLWNGRWERHTHRWDDDSHSEARQALANFLAFWTGGDESRMLRLFRSSSLCRGDDDLRTFENYEIPTSLEGRTEFYDPEQGGRETMLLPNDPRAAADADDADKWEYIRCLLGEGDHVHRGHAFAADLLLERFDPITTEENERLYVYLDDRGIYYEEGYNRIRRHLADVLGEEDTTRNENEILNRVKSATFRPRDVLGGPEGVLNLTNGVLDLAPLRDNPGMDLADLELTDHDSTYRHLRQLPVTFDPEADETAAYDECLLFLRESVGDDRHGGEAAVKRLQEHVGYALHVNGLPFKRVLGIFGPQDSGKTTFLDAVRAVIGPENTASETPGALANNRFRAANLDGKILNGASEIGADSAREIEMFKALTGREGRLTVERKGEQAYQFTPQVKHIFTSNQVPEVQGADAAFYERWTFVEFPNTVPRDQRDEQLKDRLQTDDARSAIFLWALRGYQRLFDADAAGGRGLFTGERTLDEKRALWAAHGDPLERFITDCLDTSVSIDAVVPKRDVYEAYKQFVDDVGDDGAEKQSQHSLTRKVKAETGVSDGQRRVGSFVNDSKRSKCFIGLRLTGRGEEMLGKALGGAATPDDIRNRFPGTKRNGEDGGGGGDDYPGGNEQLI